MCQAVTTACPAIARGANLIAAGRAAGGIACAGSRSSLPVAPSVRNFQKPAAPGVSGYTDHPLTTTVASSNVTGGQAQRFASGSDIPGDWWTLFHSKPLDDLIEQSLKNNPDLAAAQAALRLHGKMSSPSAARSFRA